MNCGTCNVYGHDSQGNKDLCIVAIIDRAQKAELNARNLRQHLFYLCMIAERLGPKAHNTHREEALAMLDGTIEEARAAMAADSEFARANFPIVICSGPGCTFGPGGVKHGPTCLMAQKG